MAKPASPNLTALRKEKPLEPIVSFNDIRLKDYAIGVSNKIRALPDLHAFTLVCRTWNLASQPRIQGLRSLALSSEEALAAMALAKKLPRYLIILVTQYIESRLVNHSDTESAANSGAFSRAYINMMSRLPTTPAMLRYACNIVPHLRGLTQPDGERLAILAIDKPELATLFRSLQDMPPGSGKRWAMQAILTANPPCPFFWTAWTKPLISAPNASYCPHFW